MTESRRVAASSLTGVRVKVHLQHSFGTFAKLDSELARLRRFLEYQAARFFIRERLPGDWSLLIYVSREEVNRED